MDVNDESLQEFKNAFQEKWNMDPDKGGTDAYLAYDCFESIKYAIETAGEATPEKHLRRHGERQGRALP